jgi:hypothetical protein
MIHEFNKPIPVITERDGDGYAIYVESSGMYENDIWCVVLCENGIVRHYNTSQIRIHYNSTFGIKKKYDPIFNV